MFNVTTILPHNRLQTNPCIRHNVSKQVFRKRAAQLHYVGPELRYMFWPPWPPLEGREARKCSPDPVPIVQEAGWASGSVWTSAENLAPPPGFDPRTV